MEFLYDEIIFLMDAQKYTDIDTNKISHFLKNMGYICEAYGGYEADTEKIECFTLATITYEKHLLSNAHYEYVIFRMTTKYLNRIIYGCDEPDAVKVQHFFQMDSNTKLLCLFFETKLHRGIDIFIDVINNILNFFQSEGYEKDIIVLLSLETYTFQEIRTIWNGVLESFPPH